MSCQGHPEDLADARAQSFMGEGPVFVDRAKISSHSLGEQSKGREGLTVGVDGLPIHTLSLQKAQVLMWWPRAQPQGK